MKKGSRPRQGAIRRLLLCGYSNKEIAKVLGKTEKTIKFHCTRIYKESGAKSRLDFVVREYQKLLELKTIYTPYGEGE